MKLMIVTGGTGGHIYPALALADYIKEHENADILFVGNDDRMEHTIVPEHGYRIKTLHTSGLVGNPLKKARAVAQSGIAFQKAKGIIKDFKPDLVIGFGGYVSVPVLMAAHKMGIKVVIHEQNSIAGASNKLLSKYADAIITCYEAVKDDFENPNVYLYGNPRATFAAKTTFDKKYFDSLGLSVDKPLALIVMGSLGSETVNNIMADVLKDIKNVNFLYVSGKRDYQRVKEQLSSDNVKVVDYVDQMAIASKMDFMICRAGATTSAELCAAGIVSILIPSPFVAHNHQYFNAKALADKKCAFMIEEKDLTKETLCDKINTIISDKKLCEEIRTNAKKLGYPNACEDITRLIKELIGVYK